MDIRWLKILLERKSYHPEVEPLRRPSALLQEIRAGTVRGKYRRPRDLARLPRNPVEKEAREDLLMLSDYSLRFVKELEKRIPPPKGRGFVKRKVSVAGFVGWI